MGYKGLNKRNYPFQNDSLRGIPCFQCHLNAVKVFGPYTSIDLKLKTRNLLSDLFNALKNKSLGNALKLEKKGEIVKEGKSNDSFPVRMIDSGHMERKQKVAEYISKYQGFTVGL